MFRIFRKMWCNSNYWRGALLSIIGVTVLVSMLLGSIQVLSPEYGHGKPRDTLEYQNFKKQYEHSSWKGLPQVAIVPRVWNTYPGRKWRGLQLPLLMWQPMSRLGNVMGQYASLFALGRIYGATVRQHPSMKNQLHHMFPNLSIPALKGHYDIDEFTEVADLNFINFAKAEAAAAGLLGPDRFLLTGWPFEIQLFNTYRQDIRKEFIFSDDLQTQVKHFWDKNAVLSSTVKIGIHVRRTDYLQHIKMFKSSLPEGSYFKKATDYYRKKFSQIIFVVASDDMNYVKEAFSQHDDVIFTQGSPPELDLSILASCNNSIITVGSFGFWAGYLAGGEVVYPDVKTRPDYQFQRDWYELGHLDFFTPLSPY